MESLNTKELKIAKSIVSLGLNKAAETLSFFMQEKILLKDFDINFNKLQPNLNFTGKSGDNIHFLVTEVIGELKGVCCLVFSEKEANKLRSIALPKEVLDNPQLLKEMSDAVMLEVDNIISASVITQFSNILENKIYGGVPQLKKFSADHWTKFMEDNYSDKLFIINFKAHFMSSSVDFSPEFIWLFDNSFIQSIKLVSQVDQKVEMLVPDGN